MRRSDRRFGSGRRNGSRRRGTGTRVRVLSNLNILFLQDGSQSGILATFLEYTHGKLFPRVFIRSPLCNDILAIDQRALLLVELSRKKNLFDHQTADERTGENQNPKLEGPHRRVIIFLYLHINNYTGG